MRLNQNLDEKLLPEVVFRRCRPDEESGDVLGHLTLSGRSSIFELNNLQNQTTRFSDS